MLTMETVELASGTEELLYENAMAKFSCALYFMNLFKSFAQSIDNVVSQYHAPTMCMYRKGMLLSPSTKFCDMF